MSESTKQKFQGANAEGDLTGEERFREFMKTYFETAGRKEDHEWTNTLAPYLKLGPVTASGPHPRVDFTFTVQPQHCNRLGNIHGGCIATLFDFCTSCPLALVSKPGFWMYLGVSRTLNVTYLRPAPSGSTVKIECEIVQIGQRLATIKGTMRRVEDDVIIAVCEHGKFNTDPAVKA
ncbi:HotDog domain-containing protein [Podospora australis]|uniref:HotDog domain-containing protein n=1 Tax=Podospora australis TaxID=1536484 RepID=A0AAN6X5W9_9PEZI|nr:HotDog domain-containing protein [Podospora australis]